MMDFTTFTSTEEAAAAKVPYYEDARADYAPYYASGKTIRAAQNEVREEIDKLGGAVIAFREGYYGDNKARNRKRYGYEIAFILEGKQGIIRVAGLPLRRESDAKIEKVRLQALLNVRDWLKAAVTQMVFMPAAGHPLMMSLLVDGRRTVAEYMMAYNQVPTLPGDAPLSLPDGADEIIDGEFTRI